MKNKHPAIRSKLRGAAAVELAVLLVPLVVMAFGMIEIGRAFNEYNSLVKSTRDAARYVSMYAPGEGEGPATCLAVYGQAACGDAKPLVRGLARDMVHFRYVPGLETGYGSIDVVTVSIEGYPFTSFVPEVVASLVFGDISCTMRQGGT